MSADLVKYRVITKAAADENGTPQPIVSYQNTQAVDSTHCIELRQLSIHSEIQTNGTDAVSEDNSIPWIHADIGEVSLPEVNGTISVPHGENASVLSTFLAFVGPGALVAVGYMDPGNWSTDIAGGSAFGYDLLWVILFSCLLAMFLQMLAAKVGIATNRDLAQICRDLYPQWLVYILWVVMELAIMATDMAEVLGSAIALQLLFGIPLIGGVFVTVADVFIVLLLQNKSFRYTEIIVGLLILLITVCFAVQIAISRPDPTALFLGFVPSKSTFSNNDELFIAIGILGATVMPHNLFLHSSIVLTRDMQRDEDSLRKYVKYAQLDSNLSLCGALFVNAAILILAAATFYQVVADDVSDLSHAYNLLGPLLGTQVAQTLFAVSLLASGLNATFTGTFTGQIVMEGFTRWTISPTIRRLLTRSIAILPAAIAIGIGGDGVANNLLIYSQVILSFTLPFAVFPLVHVTGNAKIMKNLVNSRVVKVLAYMFAFFILGLNILLLTK